MHIYKANMSKANHWGEKKLAVKGQVLVPNFRTLCGLETLSNLFSQHD